MPAFNYAALDAENQLIKGQIRALTRWLAAFRLRSGGMILVNINRVPSRFLHRLRAFSTISRLERIELTRLLHTFLSSGLSLNRAVKIAGEQTENARLKDILAEVKEKIEAGLPLSAAFAPYAKFFTAYYIKLIRVGEDSGTLDDTLKHLLEQQEKEYELITNIRSAMVYPVIIVLAAIAAVVFLMIFVIPTIAAVLIEYGSELPLQTRILVGLSNFIVNYGLYLLPLALLALLVVSKIMKTKQGKWYFEAMVLRLPALKRIMIEFNNARIMRAIWAPLKSGMNMNKVLDLAADTCNNRHYRQTIERSAELIHRGIPLSEVLRGHKDLYPPSVYSMIEVGENTGRVDDMLKRLSEFYEKSVNQTFKNISSVIEPFLILFIGLVIGFIAISVLTPIWKFSETI